MIRTERRRTRAKNAVLHPMRIAAVVATETVSGPGRQLTALARALQDGGVACLIIGLHRAGRPPSAFERFLQSAGVEHRIIEDRGPVDWRVASQVNAILREWGPSLVQTHSYKATAAMYALRKLGAPWPWVGFFHGTTRELRRVILYHWLDRLLLRAADRVVVMSRSQIQLFPDSGSRVQVIENAVLRPSAGVAEALEPVAGGPRAGRPVIGIVGRLSQEKGVDVFLDACAVLAQRGTPFAGVIAGDGPERDRLQAQSRRLRLESHVQFVGHVENVHPLYRSLDLLVLPSRSEGLPNTLLEALQADVPVVASAVGGVPDLVGSSQAASLVPPGSPAALADAIEVTLAQGNSPAATAARAAVVGSLSLERRVEAHLRLYHEVLDASSRNGRGERAN